MGFDIEKVGSISKIFKINSVDKKREVKETVSIQGGKDELTISQKAVDYAIAAKALKIIKIMPDIREEKINAIKEKMDRDTYKVESKDIAEKMLSKGKPKKA